MISSCPFSLVLEISASNLATRSFSNASSRSMIFVMLSFNSSFMLLTVVSSRSNFCLISSNSVLVTSSIGGACETGKLLSASLNSWSQTFISGYLSNCILVLFNSSVATFKIPFFEKTGTMSSFSISFRSNNAKSHRPLSAVNCK